jgi:hypothetical protein
MALSILMGLFNYLNTKLWKNFLEN